jgi:polar amino acid transport system ATP-binding protein
LPAPLLEIRGLEKSYGANKVLKGIDLNVAAGEVVTLIGASGSGKTTLLRCVNFLEEYEGGSVRIAGEEVGYVDAASRRRRSEMELARARAQTGMVFQMFNLFPHLSAAENIMLGLVKVRSLSKAEARERAERWLARVGLGEKRDALPGELSGGQQQRVGIARAVAMEPKLLLLDEITSALDPELVGEVLDVVRQLAEEGMTMLVVTHEMGFARDVSHRIVFMHEGRKAAEGPPKDILYNPGHERLAAFLARFRSQAL